MENSIIIQEIWYHYAFIYYILNDKYIDIVCYKLSSTGLSKKSIFYFFKKKKKSVTTLHYAVTFYKLL